MTESDDVKKNFYKKLSYNISRYQQITATSDQNLADVLGLSVPELKNRMCGIESFTAWELYQCSRHFNCHYDLLYPDICVLRADVVWEIARRLPEPQFDRLFAKTIELGREAGLELKLNDDISDND